jgi:D-sedoheptulose 7-phosphate isomerase
MSLLDSRVTDLQAALARISKLDGALASAAAAVATSFRNDGKLLVAGNGGSAAEAQHLTGELVGRLVPTRERAALPAIALHADTSSLTGVGNDYGYDRVFARQVEALGRPGDVLLVLSTSGASANLVAAVDVANAHGLVTVGLLGPGVKPLHERCAHVVAVDSPSMQVVQECHLLLIHVLAEQVEDLVAAAALPVDLSAVHTVRGS